MSDAPRSGPQHALKGAFNPSYVHDEVKDRAMLKRVDPRAARDSEDAHVLNPISFDSLRVADAICETVANLHRTDPALHTVRKLAHIFQLSPARVKAIIE